MNLKPCPFCGKSKGRWAPVVENDMALCRYCGANLPDRFKSADAAAIAWNTRPIEDVKDARIGVLEGLLRVCLEEWPSHLPCDCCLCEGLRGDIRAALGEAEEAPHA